MTDTSGPLDGIRVLDLSRVLAGPYCTMVLGDLGADVIKVEQPGKGDDTRAWGPPWAGGEAAYYLSVNRNKRSITLDIKSEQGKQIIRDLARESDIVVENFKRGTFERLGIGYDDLRKDNPGLIWANVSGYGPTGPLADKPGYDFIAQGEAGIMAITGEPDGEPMKVGVAIVDITTGLFTAVGVLAALQARQTTGAGQRVDASLFTSAVAWLANVGENHLVSGNPAKRYGNAHANIVPYQTFRARDQHMTLGVGNDRQFQALCAILGRPELGGDERYATNSARVANRDELVSILQERLLTKDADDWIAACDAANIPSGKINTIEQVFAHPQTLARDMLVEVEHPTAGLLKLAGIPFALSETPAKIRLAPPTLGQHTDEVLRERLAYDQSTIDQLHRDGIV
ncbi:MAG TPA: formyl-CoA transferase [Chloroflexi bacterium]|nr:formyl-CoA transferase [Chloroflexota bacterium]HBY46856.1 formyl-CoA transferase [Chloroflexota bacterium]